MNPRLAPEERELLRLLRSALTGVPLPLEAEEADREEVMRIAEAHAVLPLLYPVLEGYVPPEVYTGAAERCVRQYWRLLFLTRYYVRALEEGGIPTAVLKGPGAAEAYPVPEYRKSGDMDLLLLDPTRLEAAEAVIRGAGAVPTSEQHANHHVCFRTPEGVELELHVTLAEDFDTPRANRFLRALGGELGSHIRQAELLPGVLLPVPEGPYMAMTLLLHMLQHFLRSGFGLKLLCDWTAFWNRPRPREEREEYLRMAGECGLLGFSAAVTGVCVRFLGLKSSALPGREDLAPKLIREVFDAQEFGKTGAERMVMVRGGIPGYLREFHHQMRLNHPRSGRCPLLWPGLWLLTLLRFLRNNRVLRRVSLGSVLKSAGERGRLSREMDLFRR